MQTDTSFHPDFLYKADPQTLRRLQTCVYAIAFGHVLLNPLTGLHHLPDGLFRAPGIFAKLPNSFWQWLMQDIVSLVFVGILCLSLVALATGFLRNRLFSMFTVALLWTFDALLKGHGSFINHAQFGFLYIATFLAVFAPNEQKRVQQTSLGPETLERQSRLIFFACAFELTLSYTLLGLRRMSMGFGIFLDRTLLNELARQSFNPSGYGFTLIYPVLQNPFIAAFLQTGFLVITVFEILAPVILYSRSFRKVWVWLMVPFHVSTLLTMNIFFWENCALILLLYTPWFFRKSS